MGGSGVRYGRATDRGSRSQFVTLNEQLLGMAWEGSRAEVAVRDLKAAVEVGFSGSCPS